MNEEKIISIITDNSNSEKNQKDSYEEYQIIKEDYCSSPRCGIRSKIVTKSVDKIIFSPIEISTNPYFKYCVTPVKDEHFKFDFSQSETNHTRNPEDKRSKKNVNNISYYQKNSYLETNKNELKEEKDENGSKTINEENDNNITKYLNILDKKDSENNLKLNFNDNDNENENENENDNNEIIVNNMDGNEEKKHKLKGKNRMKNKNKKVSLLSDNHYNNKRNKNNLVNDVHHSILLKEKRKLSLNDTSDNFKEKKKLKKSQKNMHNLFVLNDENNHNKTSDADMPKYCKNKPKASSIFQSIKITKDNIKNIKKKISPFRIVKDKKEPVKIISSRTSTNINRYKETKKSQEDIKKTKTVYNLQEPLTSDKKGKEVKEKIKNKILDNDNSDDNKKNSINSNAAGLNKSKKKSKHTKVKSLGNSVNVNYRKYEYEGKNFERNNNQEKTKLKNDESFKKDKYETPKNGVDRRGSRFDISNNENNIKKNDLFSVKREKENVINKKNTTTFTNILEKNKDKNRTKIKDKVKDQFKEKVKDKIKDKVKDKIKEKIHDTLKNKEKENEINLKVSNRLKEKKDKKKSKKKDKNKIKEKFMLKEKSDGKKFSAKNLKFLYTKNDKENKEDELIRRDKSKTLVCNNSKNNFLPKTSSKKLHTHNINLNYKNSISGNSLGLKRMNSREQSTKNEFHLNLGSISKFQRSGRRNSTRIVHYKEIQEKITAYTNKQTIDNINEYTRQCLEIIPDLYNLEEMPRCKTKVHPIFTKNKNIKKIALIDLDETLVHCIGEINMNNVENFTRQSDAKIKVKLPGGKQITVGINVRPHWEKALNIIKDKYHIIAYTASHESYADSVINYLDPDNKYFEHRLYRSHCVLCVVNEMKFYVKDLGILDEFCDLKDVVLIDNSVLSFAYHLDNGIPISPFYDSKKDVELLDISNFLFKYAEEDDIRDKLREVYKLSEYLEIIKNNPSEESVTLSPSISVVQEDEEGERTTKNCMANKNKISFNINKPLENSIIEEKHNEGDKKEDEHSNNNSILKNRRYPSHKSMSYRGVINAFEKITVDKKVRNSFSFKDKNNKKFDSKKIYDFMNNYRNTINKSFGLRKKNKFRSFRNIDINFKKEWDEKQKELNNK